MAEVQRLLESMDDGSSVSRFVLPQSISVELSVREQDTEPCTVLDGIAAGYRQLAPMLLERARADERTYGPRKPLGLVAKWKLFPGASEVRQRQAPWPSSSMVEGTSAEQVSEAAYRLFVNANGSSGFRVSRLVLVMTYARRRRPNRARRKTNMGIGSKYCSWRRPPLQQQQQQLPPLPSLPECVRHRPRQPRSST